MESLTGSVTGVGLIPDERLSSESADRREPVRPESPCCGGYIICEGLVEEEIDEASDQSLAIVMVSQIRSTSGD
jgi:hypothetical protein